MGSVYTYGVPVEDTGDGAIYGHDLDHVLDITDESLLDNEVRRRLNDIIPVPVSA